MTSLKFGQTCPAPKKVTRIVAEPRLYLCTNCSESNPPKKKRTTFPALIFYA